MFAQRVLITGASGYLGQHLIDFLNATNPSTDIIAAYGSLETFESDFGSKVHKCIRVDLSSENSIRDMLTAANPDFVVHLAALSSPIACEKQPELARSVNSCRQLVTALSPSTPFVFLSTDQVYDGLGAPYDEQSPCTPVNVYGSSKLDFESFLHATLPFAVSLRSSLILGPTTSGACRKQSFVQFCDQQLASASRTEYFSDEFRSVVSVADIVRTIAWFLNGGARSAPGRYNMGGPRRVSRVDVARSVARRQGHDEHLIVAVERSSMPPSGVVNPPDIAMNSSKLYTTIGWSFAALDEIVDAVFLGPGDTSSSKEL
jgi:dTDP-4-dehydrorhamnose reductase